MKSAEATPAAAHYSGVLIIVSPERLEPCARDLDALEGVEVHYRHPESGRLVAVLEGRSADDHLEMLRRIQAVPGVLVAAPVYHYFDDPPNAAGAPGESKRH